MPTTRPRSSATLLLALVLAGSPAFAQVFKWTDAQGRTHYGDKAPEDAKTQEIKVQATSYDGPPRLPTRDTSNAYRRCRPADPGFGALNR